MFHKIIALFLSLTLGLTFTFAAGPDDKAAKILQDSKKVLEEAQDFAADFKYVIDNPSITRKPAPRSGKLKYSKGMYAINLPEQAIYCNLDKVWLHIKDPSMPEVTIMEYDANESFSVESIFNVYQHSSKAKYLGTETVGGKSCHKIFVAVNESGLGYNQATVWIDSNTKLPVKVSLKDRKQTETTYEFSNFKKNQGFTRNDFEFNVATFDGDVYDETQ